MQQQRWHPDTCKCTFVYSWDDTVEYADLTAQREACRVDELTLCEIHTGQFQTGKEAMLAVWAENDLKNFSRQALVDAHGDELALHINDIDWEFDDKRNVVLTVNPKMTEEKRIGLIERALSKLVTGELQVASIDKSAVVVVGSKGEVVVEPTHVDILAAAVTVPSDASVLHTVIDLDPRFSGKVTVK